MFDTERFMHKPFFEREPMPEHGHHEKPRYTMTEEIEQSARLMRETIDRLLRFEKRLKDEIAELSKHLSSDNVIFKNTMCESWNTFLMEVKNEINIFESTTSAEYQAFKLEVESNYAKLSEDVRQRIADSLNEYESKLSEFVQTINERIEQNNDAHAEAFADFQRSVTTQLNTFEQTITADMNNFRESVNTTLHSFKEAWEAAIEQRLNAQDAKLADAEMYMKTNLTSTVTTLIGDMHANGEFADILEGEVFNNFERKYEGLGKNVKYYGATGDGSTDDTDAIKLAISVLHGSPIYFPAGTYLVTEELIFDADNVEINIAPGATIICRVETATGGVIQCIGYHDTADAEDTSPTRKGLHIYGGGTVISGHSANNAIGFGRFENVLIENVTALAKRKGITGQYGCKNVTIRDCFVTGETVGAITIETGCENVTIENCVLETNNVSGVRNMNITGTNGVTVRGCRMTANGRNVRLDRVTGAHIENNVMTNSDIINVEALEGCDDLTIVNNKMVCTVPASYAVSATKLSKGYFAGNDIEAETAFYMKSPSKPLHIVNNVCTGVIVNTFGTGSVGAIVTGNVGEEITGYTPLISNNILNGVAS